MIGSLNDQANFSHKLLLGNTQVSNIRKAFANGLSANIKFSKTQVSKIVQSGGFVSNFIDLINRDKRLLFRKNKVLKKLLMK